MSNPKTIRGNKIAAILIPLAAGAAAIFVFGWLYLAVGTLTHVIAMCSDAPRWWEITYYWLSVSIPASSLLVAWGAHRWYAFTKTEEPMIGSQPVSPLQTPAGGTPAANAPVAPPSGAADR
jgi:ABC-type multidrug transport system permease subunit